MQQVELLQKAFFKAKAVQKSTRLSNTGEERLQFKVTGKSYFKL